MSVPKKQNSCMKAEDLLTSRGLYKYRQYMMEPFFQFEKCQTHRIQTDKIAILKQAV